MLLIYYFRYAKEEDLDMEGMQSIGEDSGWKQVLHYYLYLSVQDTVLHLLQYNNSCKLYFVLKCISHHYQIACYVSIFIPLQFNNVSTHGMYLRISII